MLTSGFAEAHTGTPTAIRQYTEDDEYDYESDSDLDETDVDSFSSERSYRIIGEGREDPSEASDECSSYTDMGKVQQILIPNVAYKTYAPSFVLHSLMNNSSPSKLESMHLLLA